MKSISERFNQSLGDDFSVTKTPNILNKAVTGILLASVTTGAFANTGHSMDELTDAVNPIVVTQTQELQTNYGVDTSRLMITQDTLAEFQQEGVHGTTIENPELLYEITPDNYKYVIENGISGVYANPALDGEITVIYFENDQRDNPHNLIRHQFNELGNSSAGYENDYRLLEIHGSAMKAVQGHGISVHSSVSSNGFETDANTTHIIPRGDASVDYFAISTMETILHESSHGFENTQWANGGAYEMIFDFKHSEAEEEISARAGDRILTQQFAEKTGELDNLELFRSNDTAPNHITNPENTDGHLNYFVDYTFENVINEHPDMISNMDKSQIYEYSTEMVKQSNTYDFTGDLKDKVGDIMTDLNLDKMIDSFKYYTHDDRVKLFSTASENYENKIEQMEDGGFRSVNSQKFQDYVGMIITKEIVGEFLEDAKKNPYGSFESGDDILKNMDSMVDSVVERLNDGDEPIVITNFDNNHLTAFAGTEGFIENFKSTDTFQNILSETNQYTMSGNENSYNNFTIQHDEKPTFEQVVPDVVKTKSKDYDDPGLSM